MNHPLRKLRFALSSLLGVVVLLPLAGCQSSGQSDLVARELRHQEDQIYAMEDYIAQYQQLLCQVRAENAALRRQVRESDGEPLPAPSSPSRDLQPLKKSPPAAAPPFRAPGLTPPAQQPDETPSTEEIEIIEPEVPPLEETTQIERRFEVRGQSPSDSFDQPRTVELASSKDEPPQTVRIAGRVIGSEPGHGPRLEVDVEPLSAELEPVHFSGAASLMILAPRGDAEPPVSLARWEMSPTDVEAALAEIPHHLAMRFHLELPLETPIAENTEIWVRLIPEGSDKVLEHARIDLSQSGQFASAAGSTAPAADLQRLTSPAALDPGDQKGWTISRPDRPTASSLAENSLAEWRAATQPIPVITSEAAIASSKPVPPERKIVQQATFLDTAAPIQAPPPKTRTAPAWTPDRGRKSSVAASRPAVATRTATLMLPAWSPER